MCVYAVNCEKEASVPLPEGLVLVEDFVSPEEEALLLAAVDWSHTNDDVTGEGLHIVFYEHVCGCCVASYAAMQELVFIFTQSVDYKPTVSLIDYTILIKN